MVNYDEYNLTHHSYEEDILSIENTQGVFRIVSSSSSSSSNSNSNSIAVVVVIIDLCCGKQKYGV
jgi:hypothetical protein